MNLGQVCMHCILSKGPTYLKHSCSTLAPILQIHGSEKLPSTMGALKQHMLRTHVQARFWGQAAHPKQVMLDPLQNGYHKDHDDGQLNPTTTDVPPAPRQSLRWSGVSARGTAHLNAARASQITYFAQISACATHIVKTTTRIVIQMMTVMNNVICLTYLNV